MSGGAGGRVHILLATYNGAGFLPEQLASLLVQTHDNWSLLWRDDGSTDRTETVMGQFAARVGDARCRRLPWPGGRLGACESFLALLRAALPLPGPGDAVAFADQDDVWLPEKLARGMVALSTVPAGEPALVCTRQRLIDAALRPLGLTPAIRRKPGFPSALTQNVAAGCTILLNPAAAALIAGSRAPATTLHDWWSYVLVSAAGGHVLFDPTPLVLYRQHAANLVGAPGTLLGRGAGALRRGPQQFMTLFRDHLAALAAQREKLTDTAAADVARLQAALAGGVYARLRALRMPGLCRQTALETLMFRLWFLFG